MNSPEPDLLGVLRDVSPQDAIWRRRSAEFGSEIASTINGYWERGESPADLFGALGKRDLLRAGTSIPGEQSLSRLASGLVFMELARADGSVAVAAGIQGALCAETVARYGSSSQKRQWIPPLLAGEKIGAFAMTEPEHGSDAVALETTATLADDGETYLLNGKKRWIGNGSISDVSIVFARAEAGQINAFLVDPTSPGYSASPILGKLSMRAIKQADIVLENCEVSRKHKLPYLSSFRAASSILENTRVLAAWCALGHAIRAYEIAFTYTQERVQFGKKLAEFQIIQQRLVDMLEQVTTMALMCRKLTELEENRDINGAQASLVKAYNTRAAKRVVAEARDLLGGNGILLENHVARHFADMEALHTFEGTETIQKLIVGRAITGFSAFA